MSAEKSRPFPKQEISSRSSSGPRHGTKAPRESGAIYAPGQKTTATGGKEKGRGRRASTPSEIPRRGWKDILWRVYNGISDHRVLAIAAGVTFYSLLAIFPAVAALVALYSLFADPGTIRSQLDSLSDFLPGGALAVIGDQITRVSAQGRTTLGFAFAGGFLVSLWSANAGIKALFDALNIVYNEREKRGFFSLNAFSLSFTLIAIALVLVAIAAMVALPAALAYLNVASESGLLFKVVRWPLLFLVVSLAISLIYRYGPSRERAQWRWLTWGSAFAAIAWLVMSILFSWYAESFGRFNETYGSLGAVIGFMIWMWLSNVVLLIGAELNAEMEHQTVVDTTTGPPEPMGSRNAEMADTVGPSRD
jgi:membrane protein